PDARISRAELSRQRLAYVEDLLTGERGALGALEEQVARSVANHDILAADVEREYDDSRSFGEKAADVVATFGGSWRFIIIFGAFLVVWMAVNVAAGEKRAFDVYPFILLNLVLSCIAAVQAPVIMMSQRRQESKDRLRSENDYKIDLKAELEIRHLHEKMDHLLNRQWRHQTEIQRVQLELLHELTERRSPPSGA
ncbi:MAG: DUF1003 domain-containing protein, partial [Hyphomicrobiales bacterium]|nr:DUF1003 domain-containing protein [Hyphomicrobiales bacterium]